VQKNFVGSDCPTPVMRCAFVGLPPQTPLSEHVLDREQALKLFTELEETGHVHLGFYGFIMGTGANQFMGCCNCCGDCCGVLRGINDFGLAEAPQRSNYRAVVDMDMCSACGDCIERCQVHAITEDADGMPQFNRDKCIGCGQCVIACPNDAVEMVPLPEEERFQMPGTFEEWEEVRLRNLGLPV
ncbi:MAG: 4Fe-4S binding protein, partial [Dehalococcoidia bacterium]|nr:4Fe-4S binding protein [Dehalococcoidia bacterium]